MRLRRVLITVRRIQRQRSFRRTQAFHDDVDEALNELRAIGRQALTLNGSRQAPRPSSASRVRILVLVLARRRAQLYLVVAVILIATAWFIVGESRGSCVLQTPRAVASTGTGSPTASPTPSPAAGPC